MLDPSVYTAKPIRRAAPKQQWHSVTDMSGRGFNQGGNSRSRLGRNGIRQYLDENNRYFDDNRKIYQTYGNFRQ
jgi:hypothetical protein